MSVQTPGPADARLSGRPGTKRLVRFWLPVLGLVGAAVQLLGWASEPASRTVEFVLRGVGLVDPFSLLRVFVLNGLESFRGADGLFIGVVVGTVGALGTTARYVAAAGPRAWLPMVLALLIGALALRAWWTRASAAHEAPGPGCLFGAPFAIAGVLLVAGAFAWVVKLLVIGVLGTLGVAAGAMVYVAAQLGPLLRLQQVTAAMADAHSVREYIRESAPPSDEASTPGAASTPEGDE